jgi:hypothetical protein
MALSDSSRGSQTPSEPKINANFEFLDSLLDRAENNCNFTGNWLWVESNTPYTAELTIVDKAATLAIEGVDSVSGAAEYEGPYTTLWVGNTGRGDWPECSGAIEAMVIEPLQ